VWDWLTLVGSIGLFLTLFFLILRFVPIVFSGGLAAR
jgi:molybdopterin-containing oxidoreductase family membrane subunit